MKPQVKKLTVEHLKRIIKEEVDAFVKKEGCETPTSETKAKMESVETPVVQEQPQPSVVTEDNIIAQDEEGVLAFESVAETRARKAKALKEAKIRALRKVIREMIQKEKAQKAKIVAPKKK